jgi:peptide/nickel transport system permease protein
MGKEALHKSPSYYIRQRLLSNKPAILGLIIILLSCVIATLGYVIMPDDTPNANNMAVEIQKKPPMFKAKLLLYRKDKEIEQHNFFYKLLFGQESEHSIIPVLSCEVKKDSVVYRVYGGGKTKQAKTVTKPIIAFVKAVYANKSTKIDSLGSIYKLEGETITYLDLNEQLQQVSLSVVQQEFTQNNVIEKTYYLGTDKLGRDVLSRLIFGTRISLGIGFVALLISLALGIILGAFGGFFGGFVDSIITWLMTVVWSIPNVMLVIAISLALNSKGVWVAFVAVGLTMWVEVARVVRGEILSIKEKVYVEAARAFGLSSWRIIYRHILPNMLGSLIVISSSNFASAILVEAGLSFLGLGVQLPMPSWGIMVKEGFNVLGTADSWHLIFFPSIAISVLVLAFNLLGNGLRDAYDPKTMMK